MNIKDLHALSGHVLEKRYNLLSLWQEIGNHFYPERAHFTVERTLGEEFGSHLMTSFPVTTRRDLGNSFGAMLRPKDEDWFSMRAIEEGRATVQTKSWLEWAAGRMKRKMYEANSMFVRATKEGDQDFATFGQCALSVNMNKNRSGLIYRCWHLKDVAWTENDEGQIDTVIRAWSPTADELYRIYKDKAHEKVVKKAKDPKHRYETVKCRHIVMPSESYGEKTRFEFVSVMVDLDNMHIIEETFLPYNEYVIPRWQTVSGSQYAFSPASICALPDARLIQAMTLVLLEAGEKATNPPLIATNEMIRSGIQTYAGGVTWVDAEYDERLGNVLRPISQDYSGIPMGMEMHDRVAGQLLEAFYINKIGLPPMDREATATEIAQRVQDWIRQALPLFEPMEHDYNGQVCEKTFDIMWRNGGFGSPEEVPDPLKGVDVEFKFKSPLHDNVEKLKTHRYNEVSQLILQSLEIEPGVLAHVDIPAAFRDAVEGTGAPHKWLIDKDEANEAMESQKEQQALEQQTAQAADSMQGVKNAAEANKIIAETPEPNEQPRI